MKAGDRREREREGREVSERTDQSRRICREEEDSQNPEKRIKPTYCSILTSLATDPEPDEKNENAFPTIPKIPPSFSAAALLAASFTTLSPPLVTTE